MAKHAGGADDRLARVLDTPQLARVVSGLSPEVLHHLIRHRGLNACGPLVAVATPQQMASILDLDLWQPAAAGRDDRFDAQRFGEWLAALMDEGEAVAARIVAALDRSLAIVGLSRYVRVFDPGVLSTIVSSDDGLEAEVGGYVIRARTPEAWDAIVGLLVTLAGEHPDCFHGLMRGCRRLSNSTPEADGFHLLMLAPEQVLHDVSVEREHRRSQQGYLTAADARAFLQMARQPRPSRPDGVSSLNPIAAAYFHAFDDGAEAEEISRSEASPAEASADPDVSEAIDAVAALLAEAGIVSARPRALLGPAAADAPRVTPIQPLMEYANEADAVAYFTRSRELAFLANALRAGGSVQGRAFTAQEAWDAAVGICNLGLEEATRPDAFLIDHDLVTAFEAGWRLLHKDVSTFVIEHLIATLARVQNIDTETQRDLYRLRRELVRHRDAGTPWRAVGALEPIAILDMPTWVCVCGLLGECPVWPAALTAILERRTGPVSPTAFECFTTREQIRKVHEFILTLRLG